MTHNDNGFFFLHEICTSEEIERECEREKEHIRLNVWHLSEAEQALFINHNINTRTINEILIATREKKSGEHTLDKEVSWSEYTYITIFAFVMWFYMLVFGVVIIWFRSLPPTKPCLTVYGLVMYVLCVLIKSSFLRLALFWFVSLCFVPCSSVANALSFHNTVFSMSQFLENVISISSNFKTINVRTQRNSDYVPSESFTFARSQLCHVKFIYSFTFDGNGGVLVSHPYSLFICLLFCLAIFSLVKFCTGTLICIIFASSVG